MIVTYCKVCKVLLPPMEDEDSEYLAPIEGNQTQFYCNKCMRKELGDPMVDNIEANAVDVEDIEDLQ